MTAKYRQEHWRAVIVPDPVLNSDTIDRANSTVTQDGPAPGIPVAQQDTEMVLESSGSQSSAAQLNIRTQRSGFPGGDDATFVWQQDGDSTWRGWDQPIMMTGYELITQSTGVQYFATEYPHAITLSDGDILAVSSRQDGTTSTMDVKSRRMAAAGGWAASVNVGGSDYLSNYNGHPCLVELPSGRVLCFRWYYNSSTSEAQIAMHYTDDQGTTWTRGSTTCLPEAIDFSSDIPYRIRAAYSNGQILMVVHIQDVSTTYDDILIQYASDSLGADFSEIDRFDGSSAAESAGWPEVIAGNNGGFVVGYIQKSPASGSSIKVARLGTAYESLMDATQIDAGKGSDVAYTLSGNAFSDGDLAMCRDDAGRIWIYYRLPASTHEVVSQRSDDDGVTWQNGGGGNYFALNQGSASIYPRYLTATYQRGRVVMLSNNSSTYSPSLSATYLGGYSDVTMSEFGFVSSGERQRVIGFGDTWTPIALPGAGGWTASGTASLETIQNGYLNLHTSLFATRIYTATPAGVTEANGHTMMFIAAVQAGTGEVRLEANGGSADYGVSVSMSTSTLTFADRNGTTIATAAISSDTYYQVLVSLWNGGGSCWYRAWSNTTAMDREWTLVGTDATLVDGGGTGTDNVSWGNQGASASETEWLAVAYCSGAVADPNLADGFSNPADLMGAAYSSTPVYVDDGVKIAAVDGPTYTGDDWQIETRYRYPIENALPQVTPSPTRFWRTTTSDGSNYDLIFSPYSGSAYRLPTNLFGIYIEGPVSRAVLSIDSGSGFVDYGTLDMWSSIEWDRGDRGLHAIYTSSDSIEGFIEEDELKGGVISSDTVSNRAVTIAGNGRGFIRNGNDNMPVPIRFNQTNTQLWSSSGKLIYPRGWMIVDVKDINVEKIRVRFPATAGGITRSEEQVEADALYKSDVRILAMGPVYLLGWDPSQEQTETYEHGTEIREADDGTKRSRERRRVRRRREVSWAEGVDIGPLMDGDSPAVDFGESGISDQSYSRDTYTTSAFRHDVPLTMRGLYRMLNGPSTPIVYLPRVPRLSGGQCSGVARNAEGAIYGRIVSQLAMQTLIGDEGREVFRVGFTIEEES